MGTLVDSQRTSPTIPAWFEETTLPVSARRTPRYVTRLEFAGKPLDIIELPNGLRVLFLQYGAAPVVAYQTWFRVGSRHEIEGKTGIAHLFEHLMFNESKNYGPGKFDRLLERAGAQTNAATWNDWTFYYEDVPSDQLPLVIHLEAERMANLVLRTPQLKSEQEVVANERRFRVDDDVDGTINELLYKTAFTQHPYHHPTIGWMEDILGFTTADLKQFYKTWYAPNNATIVVVGQFDPSETLREIVGQYAGLRRADLPDLKYPTEPAQTAERLLEIERPMPSSRIALGYRACSLAHPDHTVLGVLGEVLFGGRASRVYRELITRLELATDASGSASTFSDPGLFEIYITTREGKSARDVLAVFDGILAELERVPITDRERERAVARIELGSLQGLETVGGVAEQIGFYDTVTQDPIGCLKRIAAVQSVTTAQLQEAAAKYLGSKSRTVVLAHPVVEKASGT